MTIEIGDTVEYLNYGTIRQARVTGKSRDGKLLFLHNKRWLHAMSVCVVIKGD